MKLLAPLRDEIDRGQTGDLTEWSSLVPRSRRQHLGWGLQGLWPFWLVGGEATELCSRSLVFSLKLPSSTWVGASVLQKNSKTWLCIFLWVGTRTLEVVPTFDCFSCFCIPSLRWLAIVWIHPLELREGQGCWMKPISYRQEMENIDLYSRAPQSPTQF